MLGLLGPIDYLLVYLAQSFVSKTIPSLTACDIRLTSFYSLLLANYCRNALDPT